MSDQLQLPEHDPEARYILGPALRFECVREGSRARPGTIPAPLMDAPRPAALELLRRIPDDGRERFGAVFLNVRHEPTAIYTVSVGCLTQSLVHARELFGPAISAQAAAIILWHNHPSGDPEPSAEDLSLTRRLKAGGELLGIEIVDHLILGSGTSKWVSLKERGHV